MSLWQHFLHLGPDAIRPFLLKEPLEMYKDEVIDKDIMVSTSQMVRLNDDSLSHLWFFLWLYYHVYNSCRSCQHFTMLIQFYTRKNSKKCIRISLLHYHSEICHLVLILKWVFSKFGSFSCQRRRLCKGSYWSFLGIRRNSWKCERLLLWW